MRLKGLGTTALVAATVAAVPAVAAEKIKLGLGGYYQTHYGFMSEDRGAGEPGANKRGNGIARDSEIFFSGETTLDNGLRVGAIVELEGETGSDQIDESVIYFSGAFGTLKIGSDDDVAENFMIVAPGVASGLGVADPTLIFASPGSNSIAANVTEVSISGDSDKVIYYTPRVGGFLLGLSFAPDGSEEKGFANRADNDAGQMSEVFGAAVHYEGEFNGVSLAAYGGYAQGKLEAAGSGLDKDQKLWGLGAQVGMAGFTVAGAVRWNDQGTSGDTDRTDWNLGVSYGQGPWAASLSYGRSEAEAGAGLGKDTLDVAELAFNYVLGPGVAVAATVSRWNWQDNANAAASENTATVFTMGTRLDF